MSLSVRRQVKTVVQSFLFPEEFFSIPLVCNKEECQGSGRTPCPNECLKRKMQQNLTHITYFPKKKTLQPHIRSIIISS